MTIPKVVDGLSNTMALSECLINEPGFYSPSTADRPACIAGTRASPSGLTTARGYSWFLSQWGQQWSYSSYFPPNDPLHATYECYASSAGGYVGARSKHPGGVNVCMGDGAVRFVTDTVSPTIWRAISTIRGGETVGPF